MRIVGLDLGARHIAFCEVSQGKVVGKGSVRRLSELKDLLGPERGQARVAFEACREGWHVHDTLKAWGHEPLMLDTTRVRQIGVGHHGRKNDAIDAEVIAKALEDNRVPLAHVLSPERRALRAKLSVRGELASLRARQVTIIRGVSRAQGMLLPSSSTSNFLEHLAKAPLDTETRALVAPLVATLTVAEVEIARLDAELAKMVEKDAMTTLCATAPGVGIIVAATFVSVLDDAKRFRNAHAVASYLGLVPGEDTTGGKRRLGSITKQGNTYARAMLVQAAWHILRAGDKDDPLHRWGNQIATKRGKKIAAVALARGHRWDAVGDVSRRDRVRRGLHGSRERKGTEDERADAGVARKRDAERRAQDTPSDAQGGRRNSAAAGTPTEEDVDGGHSVAAVAMRLERDNESPIWKR